ncbi:MAG: hypothetical protein OXU45_09295 [Candidatus Melainabacteria bacterium]|nr:hypothetical protein [Candidatus Melainabacteria bacterium]
MEISNLGYTLVMLSFVAMMIAAAAVYWYLTRPMDRETRAKRFEQLKSLGL